VLAVVLVGLGGVGAAVLVAVGVVRLVGLVVVLVGDGVEGEGVLQAAAVGVDGGALVVAQTSQTALSSTDSVEEM
jgi:fructose-1,6-bisphosphatase/sedoheptulose 1,7-bisphosphatase-like protein